MKLYLIQHGDAVDESVNPDRPLSETGIHDVEQVGAFLSRAGVSVREICHSGKTRARQTAERFAHHMAGGRDVVACDGLKPKDVVEPFCDKLESRDRDLAVVGHLPNLWNMTARLLTGKEEATPVAFQKGGVVCLERDDDGWRLCWMVVPALLAANA